MENLKWAPHRSGWAIPPPQPGRRRLKTRIFFLGFQAEEISDHVVQLGILDDAGPGSHEKRGGGRFGSSAVISRWPLRMRFFSSSLCSRRPHRSGRAPVRRSWRWDWARRLWRRHRDSRHNRICGRLPVHAQPGSSATEGSTPLSDRASAPGNRQGAGFGLGKTKPRHDRARSDGLRITEVLHHPLGRAPQADVVQRRADLAALVADGVATNAAFCWNNRCPSLALGMTFMEA